MSRNRTPRAAAAALLTLWAASASAGLSGFLDETYTHGVRKDEDGAGTRTVEVDSTLRTRLNLTFEDSWYPLLRVRAGGLFERTDGWGDADGDESRAKAKSLNSFAGLSFGNRMTYGGIGFTRRQSNSESGGDKTPTRVRETYDANLGFQPEGLPSLDVQALRTRTFDLDREEQDQKTDHLGWAARYAPVQPVRLDYNGSWEDARDQLRGTEVKTWNHAGRVAYSQGFWRGRANLATTYNLSRQDTYAEVGDKGELETPVPAFQPLWQSTRTAAPTEGALTADSTFGNLDLLADSNVTPHDEETLRQVGLDFVVPAGVNSLRIQLRPTTDPPEQELPSAVASFFTWRVYSASSNDAGTRWTLVPLAAAATFDPFLNQVTLRFPSVKMRYLKVVVSPLPRSALPSLAPGVGLTRLALESVSSYDVVSGKEANGHTKRSAQTHDLQFRALLLQNPSLSYDFSWFFTNAMAPETTRFSYLNGLSLGKSLSQNVSTSARVAREDSVDPTSRQTSYSYGATLLYTPLTTLSHNLVFGGRTDTTDELTNKSQSLYLSNTAALYPGLDVNVSGGVAQSSSSDGKQTWGTNVSAGASVVPHPSFTLNVAAGQSRSHQSGSESQEEMSTRSWSLDVNASWSPTSALYLTGAYGVSTQPDQPRSTVRSYTAGWSPFRGGALQLSLNYSETVRPESEARESFFSPALTWKVGPKITANLSYVRTQSETGEQRSQAWGYSASLRVAF